MNDNDPNQGDEDLEVLTPRIRRVVKTVAAKRRIDVSTMCRIVVAMSMCSILTATVFWDTESNFIQAAAMAIDPDLQVHLPQLWQTASTEADAIVAALARIAYVAKRYTPPENAKQQCINGRKRQHYSHSLANVEKDQS